MNEFGVAYSHFTGCNWNVNPNNPVYSDHVKKLVYKLGLKENKCEVCGISEWLGSPIVCELHHINGDTTDNRIENLQILCPNCHSQTDNFRKRNTKVMSAQRETSDVEAG